MPRSRATTLLSALAVAVFQVVGTIGASEGQTERLGVDAVCILLVLAGPAALAVRDRWPLGAAVVTVTATLVYFAVGYAYGPVFASVVVALSAAVEAGRRRATWALAVVGYAAFVAVAVSDPWHDSDAGPLHLGLVAGWLVVVLAVSEVVRTRRTQAAERERAAAEADQRRADEQRLALAQELHDVLAHSISLINVQASVALHLLDDEPTRARPALATIKAASSEALHELRSALDVLRKGEAAPRAPAPRLSDLPALVRGVAAGGLDVRLDLDLGPGDDGGLPVAVELAAYRIVQEALTNVTRHARATTASIRVGRGHEGGADTVTVEVVDDGVGGEAAAGNGIRGMCERAASLDGTVEAGPRCGGGFRVTARLPSRRSSAPLPS